MQDVDDTWTMVFEDELSEDNENDRSEITASCSQPISAKENNPHGSSVAYGEAHREKSTTPSQLLFPKKKKKVIDKGESPPYGSFVFGKAKCAITTSSSQSVSIEEKKRNTVAGYGKACCEKRRRHSQPLCAEAKPEVTYQANLTGDGSFAFGKANSEVTKAQISTRCSQPFSVEEKKPQGSSPVFGKASHGNSATPSQSLCAEDKKKPMDQEKSPRDGSFGYKKATGDGSFAFGKAKSEVTKSQIRTSCSQPFSVEEKKPHGSSPVFGKASRGNSATPSQPLCAEDKKKAMDQGKSPMDGSFGHEKAKPTIRTSCSQPLSLDDKNKEVQKLSIEVRHPAAVIKKLNKKVERLENRLKSIKEAVKVLRDL